MKAVKMDRVLRLSSVFECREQGGHGDEGWSTQYAAELPAAAEIDPITVIIVEDEEAHFLLMKRAISRELPLAAIHHFVDADECLERLDEIDPDVVVANYLMPGMNGIELLEALRRKQKDIPDIVITGQGDERVAARAMKMGAADYLVGVEVAEHHTDRRTDRVEVDAGARPDRISVSVLSAWSFEGPTVPVACSPSHGATVGGNASEAIPVGAALVDERVGVLKTVLDHVLDIVKNADLI